MMQICHRNTAAETNYETARDSLIGGASKSLRQLAAELP
jgi:hypothetical protein